MISRIDETKLLDVKAIRFKNGDVLKDKRVYILDGFLIVATDDPEQPPTWYNLQSVEALEEVSFPEQSEEPQKGKVYWL